jgi:SAM-dependent methyltransferase
LGVPRGTIRLLFDEARRRPFSGSVLQLGRMSIFASDNQLGTWAKERGIELAPVADPALSHDPLLAEMNCVDDITFFRRLGFSDVQSLDVSDWEQADLIWDLNQPVPDDWKGRYDCVFESGTIQHVFHLPNVLANIHDLLKTGGRVVHGQAPSHNHVDHGFYMFSPTLFWDYWTTNGYSIDAAYWFEFEPFWFRSKFVAPPWRIRRYTPGSLDAYGYGGFGHRQVSLFFVATRGEEATRGEVPQQSYYERFWSDEASERMDGAAQKERSRGGSGVVRFESTLRRGMLRARLWYAWKKLRNWVVRRLPRRLPPVDLRY